MPPIPRRLEIDVYVVGQQDALTGGFGASVTYVATHAVPPQVPNAPSLVDFRTGNINLASLVPDPNYLMDIDITFTLRPFMFDMNGNPVRAIFATPTPKYGCLLINPQGNPPQHMRATALSQVKIMVDNDNVHRNQPTAQRTYSYGLGVFLPDYGNYFISLDPSVLKSGPSVKK
jgi:hypothetical protein